MKYEVYQCEDGSRRAGYWTFRADGQESEYYCPRKEAVDRVVGRLQQGRQPIPSVGTTQARASRFTATRTAKDAAEHQEKSAVHQFLLRGKLGIPAAFEAFTREFHIQPVNVVHDRGILVAVHPDGRLFRAVVSVHGVAFSPLTGADLPAG